MEKTTERAFLKITLGFLVLIILATSAFLAAALTAKKWTATASFSKNEALNVGVLPVQTKISQRQAKAMALSAAKGKAAGVEAGEIDDSVENEAAEIEDDESDEDDLSQQEIGSMKISVAKEQAVEIALNIVHGDVTDVEIERKNGHEVYAVEIDDDGDEVDVFVDIKTGEIVGTERDSGEDEEDD